MKARKLVATLIGALSLSSVCWAQQGQPQTQQQLGGAATPVQPISTQADSSGGSGAVPAARGLFVAYEPENGNQSAQTQPDDRFLSGVETLSTGILRSLTTLFDPSVFVTESADNGLTAAGQWETGTSVGGGLALLRDWNHARISAQYFGTQSFYQPNNQFNGSYHDLSLAQTTRYGRWGLLFRDDLLYSRSSDFSNSPTGGPAPTTGAATSSPLQSGLTPSQTVIIGDVGALSSTSVAQVSYQQSPRTAFTFSGTYGLLHYTGPGYIDSNSETGSVGYNYALSRLNSFSVSYSYAQDGFSGSIAKATAHTLQGSFGRRITGRLALQLGAGPQIQFSQNSFGVASGSQLSWAASAALNYGQRPKRVSYTLGYSHGLTSGSGVFYGAENDTVTGTMQIGSGLHWSGSVSVGFDSNRSLAGAAAGATRFDTWFSGFNVSRPLGRELLFTLTYQYQSQDSNGLCPVASCGITPNRQAVFTRLQWHPWPARMR